MSLYASEYPELAPLEARMTWAYKAFDIGPGWIPIIVELDKALAEITPNYELVQVKEKFGGLRYYIDAGDVNKDNYDAVYALIGSAEKTAAVTCDECGEAGSMIKTGSWYHISCGNH
jgi:hypothetical protein